jgi:hypothetical protein
MFLLKYVMNAERDIIQQMFQEKWRGLLKKEILKGLLRCHSKKYMRKNHLQFNLLRFHHF